MVAPAHALPVPAGTLPSVRDQLPSVLLREFTNTGSSNPVPARITPGPTERVRSAVQLLSMFVRVAAPGIVQPEMSNVVILMSALNIPSKVVALVTFQFASSVTVVRSGISEKR